jgi:YVTN family beta-propeller protein
MKKRISSGTVVVTMGLAAVSGSFVAAQNQSDTPPTLLVTGQHITPVGQSIQGGSFPTTLEVTPDGRYVISTSLGNRSQLQVMRADTGQLVHVRDYNQTKAPNSNKKGGLYFGVAVSPDSRFVFVSRGSDGIIDELSLAQDGSLAPTGRTFKTPAAAGVATDGTWLLSTSATGVTKKLTSSLTVTSLSTGKQVELQTPGYLLDATIVNGIGYVISEQSHEILRVDLATGTLLPAIKVGSHPHKLHYSDVTKQLLVTNTTSDTLFIVSTQTNKVTDRITLSPKEIARLRSTNPTGVTATPDGKTAYVALSALNAVAVVDLSKKRVEGYIPAGWQPTDVVLTADRLFISNAKGDKNKWANGTPKQYIQLLLEGTIQSVPRTSIPGQLGRWSQVVAVNNRFDRIAKQVQAFNNPGIEHVIYIIKENRTYDQVLSDIPRGNRDESLLMFGRDVTPNQHAIAERFVLLDNFYCAAEVSGNGWNYSVGSLANPYIERNVAYGYNGHDRPYDYEGTNNGIPADRFGITDVGRPSGGYIWDKAIRHKVSLRNYGFFTDDVELPRRTAEDGAEGQSNSPVKKALLGVTHTGYRQYDLSFADSEARVKHNISPAPKQTATFGPDKDPSRFTTWKRDFDALVAANKVPKLMLVRFGNDHTAGASVGMPTPRAMVADNDYAVGQLVEAITKSPIWKKCAIFIIEDDAQNGYDHVDAHRSTAYVISPFIKRNTLDSSFYNTDSVLRTIGLLLGMSPMTIMDATASPFAFLGAKAENDEPFTAILPSKDVIGEVNAKRTADAALSAKIPLTSEESEIDEHLNGILWRTQFGNTRPEPRRVHKFAASPGIELR